jgi:hypothetical protein
MMDYEYVQKKGNLLDEKYVPVVFEIYTGILYIRFLKLFFVCEYQLRRPYCSVSSFKILIFYKEVKEKVKIFLHDDLLGLHCA